jgi:hypothetical protein
MHPGFVLWADKETVLAVNRELKNSIVEGELEAEMLWMEADSIGRDNRRFLTGEAGARSPHRLAPRLKASL